jgi:hypothetical protein
VARRAKKEFQSREFAPFVLVVEVGDGEEGDGLDGEVRVEALRRWREVEGGRRRRCEELFREMVELGEDEDGRGDEAWVLYRRCWWMVVWDLGWTSARLEGVAVARVLRRTPRMGTVMVVGCIVEALMRW